MALRRLRYAEPVLRAARAYEPRPTRTPTSRLAKRRERGPRQGEAEHTEAEAEAEAGRAAERQSGRETERDVEARCGGARLGVVEEAGGRCLAQEDQVRPVSLAPLIISGPACASVGVSLTLRASGRRSKGKANKVTRKQTDNR